MCSNETGYPKIQYKANEKGICSDVCRFPWHEEIRSIWKYITGDSSAAEFAAEETANEHVLEFLAERDDPDLMFDMRSQNGRPNSTKFDQFWAELDRFLDEQSAVHEILRQMYMYMPFAISMEDPRQQIKALLSEGTPVPSISWMSLHVQFCP